MHSVLLMLSISAVLELAVHIVHPRHRWLRAAAAFIALCAVIFCTEAIVLLHFWPPAVPIVYLSLYRVFNQFRIIKGRMHAVYLWRVTYRSSLWLSGLQYIYVSVWFAWQQTGLTIRPVALGGLALVGIAALVSYIYVAGHVHRMQTAADTKLAPAQEWPTVTVAIPARNETESLHDCISSVLAAQYPKLEILVLDDDSQTRRTPEIIRSFAHDGVRFIKGEQPRETWLAKNQAYDTLAQEASGEYIVFLGADIRLQPSSLRKVMAYMLEKRKSMVSIMPHNVLFDHRPMLVQPMRYFWEVGLPRRLVNRPPVLSSFWVVKKEAFIAAGGMKAATRMIVPEAFFARNFSADGRYSFLASGPIFGVTSLKDRREQRDTSVRVAYPQVHRRPELVALIGLACILWAAMPAIAIVYGFTHHLPALIGLSALDCLAWGLVFNQVLKLAYGRIPILSVLCLPVAILNYAMLLNYSMYKYEFSEVIWKGRNVSGPVMHVVPHLPPL